MNTLRNDDERYLSEHEFWAYLREQGIIPLTGEACGLGMRQLCDVTEAGVALLDRFFGGVQLTSANCNSGAARSIMLPRQTLAELVTFCMCEAWPIVFRVDTRLTWIEPHLRGMTMARWDAFRAGYPSFWQEVDGCYQVYARFGDAQGGTRNVHTMSYAMGELLGVSTQAQGRQMLGGQYSTPDDPEVYHG